MINNSMSSHAMSVQSDSRQLPSRLRWISHIASVSAVLVGGLVLIGWWFDVDVLKSPAPEFPTMKANTALAFVLAGLSLWWLRAESTDEWRRRIAQLCAATVAAIGLLA